MLVSQDPVQAADGAIRHLLSLQPENESLWAFLMRLAEQELRNRTAPVSDTPASSAEPIVIDKPRRTRKPQLAENETLSWPPIRGQKYVGPWPPRGLVTPQPRYAKGPTFDLDDSQKAWLERYSEKYPDACNPWQLLTPKEADAREARQLLSAELVS